MDLVRFDTEKGVIDRQSAGVEVNPFDLNALEAAVRLKETDGGEVIALSMGPQRAETALQEALARGADQGILLTDRSFAGADTRATAFLLAQAIKKMGSFDLVIAGEMTVDGDTAQVGPQTAEFLGIPHIAYVTTMNKADNKSVEVNCSIWEGVYRKHMQLPGLLTVTKDINRPRMPTLRDKVSSRNAEITQWHLADFAGTVTAEEVGQKGSPTRVRKIVVPPPIKRKGTIWGKDELEAGLAGVCRVLEGER